MAIFTPKKVIDGANNIEMITGSPYVFRFIMVTTITYYNDDKPACSHSVRSNKILVSLGLYLLLY